MKLPEYSAYKNAKTEWIEHIPSHWEEWKVSHGFRRVGSGTTPKSDNGLFYGGNTLWVTTAELRESVVYETANKVTQEALDEHSALRVYPAGSVMIAMYGATIGRLGILGHEATVNQACCVFSLPEKFDPRFFYFWMWMRRPILISLSSGGGQPNLNQEELKRLRVPIPSIPEQQQIAAFLDWKTGQIDALLGRKRELLEKLKEKRLAVITQAVTRGLNPAAPLKDSGIPWLGQVPQHWTLNYKLGFISASERNSFVNGPFGSDLLTSELVDEGVPVLYSGDVKATKFLRKSAKYVTEDKAQELDFCRADAGDLLLAKVGDPPGDACVYPVGSPAAVVTQDVIRIRVDRGRANPEYLSLLLVSEMGRHLVRLVSIEATRGRFSLADLKNIRFPLPPLAEQEQIAKRISKALKRIDEMYEINETAIDRLTEYRTALITAATTGKIDVRGVKIPSV